MLQQEVNSAVEALEVEFRDGCKWLQMADMWKRYIIPHLAVPFGLSLFPLGNPMRHARISPWWSATHTLSLFATPVPAVTPDVNEDGLALAVGAQDEQGAQCVDRHLPRTTSGRHQRFSVASIQAFRTQSSR